MNALGELEEKAIALFERDSNVADKLDLTEPQIERFFTGRWEDFDRVPTPDGNAWRIFLEEAAGPSPTNWMRLAVGIAADTLGSTFSGFSLTTQNSPVRTIDRPTPRLN